MYKHLLTVIVWPAVKKTQQWLTSAGTYISRLYRQELLFLVDVNKEDHPPSNKGAFCGVRPADTMQNVAASSVAASLGIRTLLRSCSVTRCPGYNALTLVTRVVARYFGKLRRSMWEWNMAVHLSPIVRSRMKQMCNPLWSFSKSRAYRTNHLTQITVMSLSASWLGSMRAWAKIERSCCTRISSARSR